MNKKQAITDLMATVNDDDIVISSVGHTSRILYHVKDRPLNFYMMGSMGCELAMGIGMALNTDRRVHVISGNGSALMGLSTIVVDHPFNLTHYILDDQKYESTGGQQTSSIMIRCTIIIDTRCKVPERIPLSPIRIKERFYEAVHNAKH